MSVLKERALELKASSLLVAPDHHFYPNSKDIGKRSQLTTITIILLLSVVGIPGSHQLMNASLAVQTCRVWLQERGQWPLTSGEKDSVEYY